MSSNIIKLVKIKENSTEFKKATRLISRDRENRAVKHLNFCFTCKELIALKRPNNGEKKKNMKHKKALHVKIE